MMTGGDHEERSGGEQHARWGRSGRGPTVPGASWESESFGRRCGRPAGVVHNGRVAMPGLSFRSNVANVLVIGTGAAGLRAAIAAHQAGSEVVVLGKRRRDDAHTVLAAGGINAALGSVDPEDSWQQHFADTLREGYFPAHPRVGEVRARAPPAAARAPAAATGGCSARSGGGGPAMPATGPAGPSCAPWPPRAPPSA